jgi:sialidase-1
MPCEVFCEIGLDFKAKSPLQPAFMVSLNHGYFGYLPTPRHHKLGGYETWLGTNRLEIEASDKMLAQLVEMATEIKSAARQVSSPVPLEPALNERCLEVLRAGLARDEFWPAMHAAEALTIAGHGNEVLAALAKRTPTDDQQRCGLAREAVRAGDKSQAEVLLAVLTRPGSNGHTHAAESLFKVGLIGDGKGLKAAAAQDDDRKLKLMAAAALARSGDARALDLVRLDLDHEDRENRKVAAWILGQIGSSQDIPRITKALAAEDEPLARAYFANALACLGDATGRKLLGKNLDSDNPAVRTYAADFAGHSHAVECRTQLIKLLDDQALDVRIRAAQSLVMLSKNPRQ